MIHVLGVRSAYRECAEWCKENEEIIPKVPNTWRYHYDKKVVA